MSKTLAHLLVLVLTVVFATTCIFAQLDPAFGTNGKTIRSAPFTQVPIDSFLLPDGKILVMTWDRNGSTNDVPITYSFVRFNADGSVDTSYGTNGAVQLPIPFLATQNQYNIFQAVRQPDGKIVAVGSDGPNGLMVRLNENGTLDTSFSGDGIHRPNINQTGNDSLARVLIQPDGRIVAIGGTQINNVNSLFLIRYETNGELDFAFGDQGGFIVHPVGGDGFFATGFGRQSSGKYVALGSGQATGKALRFNSDGTADASFASPTFGSGDATSFLLLSDDRMVVGGYPFYTDALFRNHADIKLTRLNINGAADSTFGNGGTILLDIVSGMFDYLADVIELPGGAVGVAGTTLVYKNRSPTVGWQMSLFTVDNTGAITGRSLAMNFDPSGGTSNLLRQPDGKLIVTGAIGDPNNPDVLITRHLGVPLDTYRLRGIPFEFSLGPGSGPFGISQTAEFRPSSTKWYASPFLASGVQFGLANDVLAAGDFYGDYGSELAVFRPSNGTWYISKGYSSSDFVTVQWGSNGDVPAAYDYDGDGKYDVTVFRPSDGNWYIRQSSDSGVQIHHWGVSGDKPVVGDYDGDGLGDLAIWRPSTGVWYIHRSSDGQAQVAQFGLNGDIPVQEDYDGDLKTDIGVFRPSTGVWYIWRSSDGGFTIVQYGLNGDVPTPADYDGDRKIDISVYRPSTSRWYWIRSGSGTGEQFVWGISGDIAVQGRY
jgi:uncharacterized delta-60 repeat protein